MESTFWLKSPDDDDYREVSKDEYVRAERANGFHNTLGQPDQPATAAFSASTGEKGAAFKPGYKPIPLDGGGTGRFPAYYRAGHHYYDRAGKPISLIEWAETRDKSGPVQEHTVQLGTTTAKLRTVWLGFLDPAIFDARLFGTAMIVDTKILQIEVHDTEDEAIQRHNEHLAAIAEGHHCARCKDGRAHVG